MKEKNIEAQQCKNHIQMYTDLKVDNFKSLIRKLSKDSTLNIKNVFDLKRKYFHRFKEQKLDNGTCELLSFVEALKNTYDLGNGSIRKNKSMEIENIKNNNEQYINSLISNIKTPAWDFLLLHYSDIKECYQNGLSSRKTRKALNKMHKSKIKEFNDSGFISHTTINDFFNEHFRIEKRS